MSIAAKPTTSLIPTRAIAAAALSTSARTHAGAVQAHGAGGSLVNKNRKEIPLVSQEGTKGVIQYAL